MTRPRKPRLLDAAALGKAAECLRILAHPQRLQMIQLLLTGEPIPVGTLAGVCGIPQPQASEHLRLMQRCGFLKSERRGREVFYGVAEPHLASILACMEERFGNPPGNRP